MPKTESSSSSIANIEFHVRSYRSALKSTLEVTLNSLINSHLQMHSLLHPHGNQVKILDTSAFCYSLSRLPSAIDKSLKVIIGQNPEIFSQAGFTNIENWPKVSAQSRRHVTRFNAEKKILAYFAASISDIDDLVGTLIAYQVEWNKFHDLIRIHYPNYTSLKKDLSTNAFLEKLKINPADWPNIIQALGRNWKLRLKRIFYYSQNLKIQLLASSWINYTKTTQKWWKNIASTVSPKFHISRQEIYFVSSNTHSILNIFTGFALKHQTEILSLLQKDNPEIFSIWEKILNKERNIDPRDFIYFAFKYYSHNPKLQKLFTTYKEKLGIISISNSNYLNLDVQIFPVKSLAKSKFLDSRIKIKKPQKIAESKALIFNIDYPLGFSAYHVLTEIMENVKKIKGVYIMGKAAILNGKIGDIQIPRLVFDEHTQNSYMINNCFNSFFPFTDTQNSILTNQKAVSVLGTFLENRALLNYYSKNNLTIIEMESGPYLGAITEASYDQQTPKNTIIDLNSAPLDLGIIYYSSDTPFNSLQNLGNFNLGINGIEPVTIGSLAILQRIINQEENT